MTKNRRSRYYTHLWRQNPEILGDTEWQTSHNGHYNLFSFWVLVEIREKVPERIGSRRLWPGTWLMCTAEPATDRTQFVVLSNYVTRRGAISGRDQRIVCSNGGHS